MKSQHVELTLVYVTTENIDGIATPRTTSVVVKALSQRVFESRKEQALADGMPLTHRLTVAVPVDDTASYAVIKNKKFKIRSINEDVYNHVTIVELGEQR